MNTSAVAKMLGVSPSTIQRWVKQANLRMERTELGHYQFSEESIEILKDIKKQLNNGVLLQDLKHKGRKPPNKASVITGATGDKHFEKMNLRMDELERKLEAKADEVVSYQLLQHRREIEELQQEIGRLNELILGMAQAAAQKETMPDPAPRGLAKINKWKNISSLFGF